MNTKAPKVVDLNKRRYAEQRTTENAGSNPASVLTEQRDAGGTGTEGLKVPSSVTRHTEMLRAALQWALKGHHATSYDSGFAWKGCGCCSYSVEPPAEIDALVREVRREMLSDETKVQP